MSPAEAERIRLAAIERGRAERRAQGIPAEVTDKTMTARLAALILAAVEREMEKAHPGEGGLDGMLQRVNAVIALHEVA